MRISAPERLNSHCGHREACNAAGPARVQRLLRCGPGGQASKDANSSAGSAAERGLDRTPELRTNVHVNSGLQEPPLTACGPKGRRRRKGLSERHTTAMAPMY